MRPWTRTLSTLVVASAALALTAPAHAGSAPVLQFLANPAPSFGSGDGVSVAVGQSLEETFTLKNTGGSASAAVKVTLAPATAFVIPAGGDGCTGVSLGPGKTCTVTVRYTPTTAGASDSATLTAAARKPVDPATLTLTGSSPTTALSIGCQFLKDFGHLNLVQLLTSFNAGEVITLTATAGTVALHVGPQGSALSNVGDATAPDSVSYTIPSSGPYEVAAVSADAEWRWSCAAGSPA